MAGQLANIANGVSQYFSGKSGAQMSPAPQSAAIAAANGYSISPAVADMDDAKLTKKEAGEAIYRQFGRMVLAPTPRAAVTKTAYANFSQSLSYCTRNTRYPALCNYLLLLEGFEISQDGKVLEIAHAGDFANTLYLQRAAYAGPDGYMTQFRDYVRVFLPDEEKYIVQCRLMRQQFQTRYEEYAQLLPGLQRTDETLRVWLSPEHFVVIPAGSDAKHAAALVSGALAARSASNLAESRAKRQALIAARTEEMRKRYANGESAGQLVRAGGDSRLAIAQPAAEKTLTTVETNQLVNAFALMELGRGTRKAAAQAGDKDEGKVARAMQREAVATIRRVAASWPGAMTYVDVKNAVAKHSGAIWALGEDGSTSVVSYPVYVVADTDDTDWFVVKRDAFDKICSVGRHSKTHYDETHRVKLEDAGDVPVQVVPLTAKAFRIASGNNDDLLQAYEAQLLAIRKKYWKQTAEAPTPGRVVPRAH